MKKGNKCLNMSRAPLVVASVVSSSDLKRVAKARAPVWDVVEIRLDLIRPCNEKWLYDCERLMKNNVPVLLTIRSKREGGAWNGSEKERVAEYIRYLPHASAVDVEVGLPAFEEVMGAAYLQGKTVIGSFHDFKKTPRESELRRLICQSRQRGVDIVKVATMVRGPEDIVSLFQLLSEAKSGPLCLIGMGSLGRWTRLGLPEMGSCLAYGHIGTHAAPGQWHCRDLRRWLIDGKAGNSSRK